MSIFNDRVVVSDADNVTLIEFNIPADAESRWWCDEMIGWRDTSSLNAALVNSGTSDGASPANRFPAKERYLTLEGACQTASRQASEEQMDRLVYAFSPGVDLYVTRYTPVPKRMKVRLFDQIVFPQEFEQEFRWSVPLVIPGLPIKESLDEEIETVNTFAGGLVYREYTGGVNGDTNFAGNISFETDVTSFVTLANAATVTRVSSPTPASGSWAARVVTSATASSGIAIRTPNQTPNSYDPVTWNGTVSLRGNVGGEVIATWLRINFTDGTTQETTKTNRTLTTSWQAFSATIDSDESKSIANIEMHARAPGTTAGVVFFVDYVHINAAATPSAQFHGGSTSAFWTGTPNLTPASRQSNPKSPGKRSYTSFARTYSQGSVVDEEETVVDSAMLANNGNAWAYPVTTVEGPLFSGAWEIRNETTGERLSFRIDIPEGQELIIDHRDQTATINGQSVEFRKDGEWWGLKKGLNRVRLASDQFNINAKATFRYRHAWRN